MEETSPPHENFVASTSVITDSTATIDLDHVKAQDARAPHGTIAPQGAASSSFPETSVAADQHHSHDLLGQEHRLESDRETASREQNAALAIGSFHPLFSLMTQEQSDPGSSSKLVQGDPSFATLGAHDPTSIITDDTHSVGPTSSLRNIEPQASALDFAAAIPILLSRSSDNGDVFKARQTAATLNSEIEKLALAFGTGQSDCQEAVSNDLDDDGSVSGKEQVNTGRVDSSQMAVLENPLSKSDRYTVIRGRLPDDDPYMKAVASLGLVFVSNFMRAKMQNIDASAHFVSEEQRKAYFMEDVEHFNKELNREFKIPIIGGGQLSLYALAQEVMKLGGLRNVVLNRAFRIVSQQLELPKSCTSAAYVLKNAYERLLYHYEQKVAFGVLPEDPSITVDMKSEVLVERKKDEKKPRARKQPRSKGGSKSLNHSALGRIQKGRQTIHGMGGAAADGLAREVDQRSDALVLCSPRPLRRVIENSAENLESLSILTENLTPQQPPPTTSLLIDETASDIILDAPEWDEMTEEHVNDLLAQTSFVEELDYSSRPDPGARHVQGHVESDMFNSDKPFEMTSVTTHMTQCTHLSGDDPQRAQQAGIKILSLLRNNPREMELADLPKQAARELVSSALQALMRYLETYEAGEHWRMEVAGVAGEIICLLLFNASNQQYLSRFYGFWPVLIAVLSSGKLEGKLFSCLWKCAAIMSPHAAASQDENVIVQLLNLACACLRSSKSHAAEAVALIYEASPVYVSERMTGRDFLIEELLEALTPYILSADRPTRLATMRCVLYLCEQFPKTAARTHELITNLIGAITDEDVGALATKALRALRQASTNAPKCHHSLALDRATRVIEGQGL